MVSFARWGQAKGSSFMASFARGGLANTFKSVHFVIAHSACSVRKGAGHSARACIEATRVLRGTSRSFARDFVARDGV